MFTDKKNEATESDLQQKETADRTVHVLILWMEKQSSGKQANSLESLVLLGQVLSQMSLLLPTLAFFHLSGTSIVGKWGTYLSKSGRQVRGKLLKLALDYQNGFFQPHSPSYSSSSTTEF